MPRLSDVRGCLYLPTESWNAYQLWADYEETVVERDLGYAKRLRLNAIRVFCSYEHWREVGDAFFDQFEHFLGAAATNDIQVLPVLFESLGREPTESNRKARDPKQGFAIHSPSRKEVLQPRNWKGYDRSPRQFTRRFCRRFGSDDRLLAIEIMNEPGDVQPRRDFVYDMLAEANEHAMAPLTMGCKDFRFNHVWERRGFELDVHQFHYNLPPNAAHLDRELERARAHKHRTGKPLWLAEWQRVRAGPPSRFLPNYENMAERIHDARANGEIDGDFFWGLMFKPAYLSKPRRAGRVNGVFHPDGSVFSRSDAEAIAGAAMDVAEQFRYPESFSSHPFPYPSLTEPPEEGGILQLFSQLVRRWR